MKKFNFSPSNSVLTALFCLFLLSCQKDEQPLVQSSVKPEEIEYRGERVIVNSAKQKELLGMDTDEFTAYYRSLHDQSNLRTSTGGLGSLSYDELVELVTPHLVVYPDISWEKEISKEDQEKIYRDIPSIKSVDDIRAKGDIIVEYYSSIALERILPDIINYKKTGSTRSARVEKIAAFNVTDYEQSVLLQAPSFIPFYVTASGIAFSFFGHHADHTKGNTSMHAAWNALAMRFIILSGVFKDPATTYVRKGTSAHEMHETTGAWLDGDATLMDLNSNIVGRTWTYNNTSWGLGPARVMPTESRIISEMTQKGNDGYKMTYQWHILDRFPPGGSAAWNILYTHNTGVNPFLLYTHPL
jgi:hypothetical protein